MQADLPELRLDAGLQRPLNKINPALYSSAKEDWGTPDWFFDAVNAVWRFTLDAAASAENHKVDRYFTKEQDGLAQSWKGERVFLNPPYSRGMGQWMRKCYEESRQPGTIVVALVPARTDNSWWQTWVLGRATHIHFVRGRIKFVGAEHGAPFPSALITYGSW